MSRNKKINSFFSKVKNTTKRHWKRIAAVGSFVLFCSVVISQLFGFTRYILPFDFFNNQEGSPYRFAEAYRLCPDGFIEVGDPILDDSPEGGYFNCLPIDEPPNDPDPQDPPDPEDPPREQANRILDCRLPGPGNTLVKVPPIIVPNYATVGQDHVGLARTFNGNLYTLNTPSRSLYGDGNGGPQNTQIELYNQPLSINQVTPASTSTPQVPGGITQIALNDGEGNPILGRPMDIGTVTYSSAPDYTNRKGNTVYVFVLRPVTGVTSLAIDSDVQGDVEGVVYAVNPTDGFATEVISGLPAAGYAKDFSDMAVAGTEAFYFDDVRDAITSVNEYSYITNYDGGISNITFPTNTFYDIARGADADRDTAYTLIGATDTTVDTNKTGIYEINFNTGTTLVSSLPVLGDGGDIETADADDIFDPRFDRDDYIYYTANYGTDTGPALVRYNQNDNTFTSSNSEGVDSNFTSVNTGYMDKVDLYLQQQIIYYKNGSRTQNSPDETIGKIYCPRNEQDTPPDPSPTPTPSTTVEVSTANPTTGTTNNTTSTTNNTTSTTSTTTTTATGDTTAGTTGTTGDTTATTGGTSGGTGGTTTTATGDTTSSTTTNNTGTPQISIVKSSNVTGSTVNSGQNIQFTLTVTNSGTGAATGFTVSDVIDADIEYVANSCQTTAGTCIYNPTTRVLSVDIASLGAGASTAITFNVTVN